MGCLSTIINMKNIELSNSYKRIKLNDSKGSEFVWS